MRRTRIKHDGLSDLKAAARAAAKTSKEEIYERDFIRDSKNKREYKVNEVYSQQTEKNIIIPELIRLHLKGIRNSLKKKDKIQYVGIDELLSTTNLDEINNLFIDILRGLDDNTNEYKNLIRIQNILNTKVTRRLKPNMRKKALRNSRKHKKKQKKGGRRTRGKKRKGGNKRQIQINTNQIKKNSQNLKKLKLRMERCACKEEEEDGYDKLRRSDFLSDIELQPPPKPIKVKKENRTDSPTSIMDEPTGAAALALRMGGGYPQKRRRKQKGGERTPGNWIKYNEILTTDICIFCNNSLMNPRSPEKTAYMMNCGCVAHTDCINKHCERDPNLLCPQCGLEIWESCTDVDEYLNALPFTPGDEHGFAELPDILENPDQYWRPARSRRRNRIISHHRPRRTVGGVKTTKKSNRKPRDQKPAERKPSTILSFLEKDAKGKLIKKTKKTTKKITSQQKQKRKKTIEKTPMELYPVDGALDLSEFEEEGAAAAAAVGDRIPFDLMGGTRNRTVPEGIVVQPSDLPVAREVVVGRVHRNPRQHMIHLAKKCKNKFDKACRTMKRIVRRELPRNGRRHTGGRKKKRKTKKMKRKRKTKKKHHKKRKWSLKYKRSINCKRPKGFSQRQYCKYKKI